jgi:hypothetical protein
MKELALVALITCLSASDGCDPTAASPKQTPRIDLSAGMVAKETLCTAEHRFERTEVYPIGLRADIALDTCTGSLCRTWPWQAKDANSAWSTYENLPTLFLLAECALTIADKILAGNQTQKFAS